MKDNAESRTVHSPRQIAGRYRVREVLGRGGMAVVYRVTDLVSQKELALKKLSIDQHRDETKHKRISELFEKEYYTLSQLSHPRVVEVYDFGIADQDPYYTMEILDGGDVRELAPLPWRDACSLIRDICSVLSLLHSRRLVHRDVSPRNIRCTTDSKAKLIDFGAMVPMGPCKHAVGTPSFTAPEVTALQFLDAQADLYSLGTTFYYALTGKNAYPAGNFSELRLAWQKTPSPPSCLVDTIPKALDDIVMSLIDLEPMARPVNAAEVIERLNAVASLDVDDHLLVSQAYLLKPTLVGREEQILKVRKKLARSLQRKGTAVAVVGSPGVGRTRFLDACALEGKLSGATVLRADANDAQAGDWGVVRALATSLVESAPEVALEAAKPYLPVLGHVIPELLDEFARMGKLQNEFALECFEDRRELRPRVQEALREWLNNVSEQQSLFVAVDDVHRIDEPSAAFVAVFANHISDKKVILVVTIDIDETENSRSKLLVSAASSIKLKNLSDEDVSKLLISIFGDVPQVQFLSDRFFKISRGNPGAILQLAQQLVDRGVIQYQAGSWSLPHQFETDDLPDSLSEALRTKVAGLSNNALKLAQTLALNPRQSFTYEECLTLIGIEEKALLIRIQIELQTHGIGSSDGHNIALSQPGWVSVLLDEMNRQELKTGHAKLAEVFIRRGNQACRAAKHLFEAGQEERALDILVEDCQINKAKIEESSQAYLEFVISLPKDWVTVYERALAICRRLNRPKIQRYYLQVMMVRIGDQTGLEDTEPVLDVVQQLIRDSGLEIYHQLDNSVEPEVRLQTALQLAQKRYSDSPETERVLTPSEAIFDLAKTLSNTIGIAATSYDYELLEAMPSMVPFKPLSPALGVIYESLQSIHFTQAGLVELAAKGMSEILQRIAEPDRAGFNDTVHRYLDLGHRWGLGLIEASLGIKSSIKWVEEIEKHPLHRVNAWRIRMVYYLRQGDIQKVEECIKRIEILQIENSPTQFYEGLHQFSELAAYSLVDDLIRVKRIIPGLEAMAKRFSPWIPIHHLAQGEYQRIRGDFSRALIEFEKGLNLVKPGRHVSWPSLAAAKTKTLLESDRIEEAMRYGIESLYEAEKVGLKFTAEYIRMPLAIVQATLKDYENALNACCMTIDTYLNLGTTGIALGVAYETRAHVAILMDDREGFEKYARLCAQQYKRGNYPVLIAKYEKLMQRAKQAKLFVSADLAKAAESVEEKIRYQASQMVSTLLTDCKSPQERAQRGLELLLGQSNSSGGYLYVMQKNGPVLSAQLGNFLPSVEIDGLVRDYIQAETSEFGEMTMTMADLREPTPNSFQWPSQKDKRCQPVLIGHSVDDGFAITGMVVLWRTKTDNFDFPQEVITALSKSLLDSGDATTLVAA